MRPVRYMLAAFALMALPHQAAAQDGTLRVAIADDADIMDPTIARTYTGRIVFAGICDKLFDINEKLDIVPQLATAYEWADSRTLVIKLRPGVQFHDGTAMDAAAVKYSLERHLTMPGSTRRGEISSLDRVEIVDPLTVRLVLKTASSPFVTHLTDRSGMIVSPKAAEAAGKEFGNAPVCAGPFKLTERVAQDRFVLDRFPAYWDAANIHFARVIYRPIVDSSVRFTNIQAGAIDIGERIAATDVARARTDQRLKVDVYPGLGYQSISLNVGHGPRANTPLGRSALVRKAFELSIDREAINQVVFAGLFAPNAQGLPPGNPFYNKALPPPARDVAKARALLKEAGVTLPVVINLTVTTVPEQLQTGEMIQSMAAEAGFDVKVRATEFASALAAQSRGDFEASAIGWSGRIDPDGNLYNGIHSGGSLNETHYANKEVDGWLDAARATTDAAARLALYAKVTAQVHADLPILYLSTPSLIVVSSAKLSGFRPVPDGIVRLQGLKLAK